MTALAAPATVPPLVAYGISRGLSSEVSWRSRWFGIIRASRSALYGLRIVRRSPAPVLERITAPTAVGARTVEAMHVENMAQRSDISEERMVKGMFKPKDVAAAWYAIDRAEVIGREHLLDAAGVAMYRMPIKVPDPKECVGIAAKDMDAFISALDLSEAECEDEKTDVENVLYRSYDSDCGDIDVAGVDDDTTRDLVLSVLRAVSTNREGIDLTFVRHRHREEVRPAESSERVRVHYFARPSSREGTVPDSPVTAIYGRERPNAWRFLGIPPTEGAGRIIRDAAGTPVAQIVRRSVFILVDILSDIQPWTDSVLARILYESVDKLDAQADDAEVAAEWRRERDRHKDHYVTACLEKLEVRGRNLSARIAALDNAVQEAGKAITKSLIEKREAERELARLSDTERGAEAERLQREFDQLAACEPVVAVRAYPDRIEVDTKTVHIEHLGRKYEIGRMRVVLRHDGNIEFFNLTSPHGGCAHPHVSGNRACLGNITQAIAKLMAEREYAVVINMLFRFLESYNPQSPHSKIENWKEVRR
jgi:hypothetical protein